VQALATLDGTLLAVTDPVEGRTHDRRQTWNTGISRIRAAVEHAITHLEQWKTNPRRGLPRTPHRTADRHPHRHHPRVLRLGW
jgi:hypothetical protein